MTYIKYFSVALILISCNSGVVTFNKKNDKNGLTKTIINESIGIIRDSVFDHLGTIRKVIDYYDNQREHVKKVSNFKNDRLDSTMLLYYYNGNVKSKRYCFEGKECFERTDFNENGKISAYIFLASDQRRIYIRSYDTIGNCIGVKGTPFFEAFMYANANYIFSTKDTVTAYFYAPNPPDCNTKLYTIYRDKEINNINPLTDKFISRVKLYPLSIGNFDWLVRMKIYYAKSDSLLFTSDALKISYQVH